jgi:hypothetical protein
VQDAMMARREVLLDFSTAFRFRISATAHIPTSRNICISTKTCSLPLFQRASSLDREQVGKQGSSSPCSATRSRSYSHCLEIGRCRYHLVAVRAFRREDR